MPRANPHPLLLAHQMTGVAALLRFPLPELVDDEEDSTDSEAERMVREAEGGVEGEYEDAHVEQLANMNLF